MENRNNTKSECRIRISTVFLILGMINMPFATYLIPYQEFGGGEFGSFMRFYIYDFTSISYGLCLMLSVFSIPISLWKKKWKESTQYLVQAVLSIAFVICIPVSWYLLDCFFCSCLYSLTSRQVRQAPSRLLFTFWCFWGTLNFWVSCGCLRLTRVVRVWRLRCFG